jgi:hypothetical protein
MSIRSKAKRDRKKALQPKKREKNLGPQTAAALMNGIKGLIKNLTTPTQITPSISEFCKKLSPEEPIFLSCEPELWSRQSCCDLNVQEFIRLHGGSPVFGYRIWSAGTRYVEAERHAVWTDGSSIRDVSFVDTGESTTVFLPDEPSSGAGFDDGPQKVRCAFDSEDKKLVGALNRFEPPIRRMEDAEAWARMLTFEDWKKGRRMPNLLVDTIQ